MLAYHPYHLHRLRLTDLRQMYLAETIKGFAYSIVGIFIPIYLLNQGVSLPDLCAFMLLMNAVRVLLEIPIGQAIARFGAKHVLALSYPASFVYIVAIAYYQQFHIPLWTIALAWALADGLHWTAYETEFSKVKHASTSGREMSAIGALSTIAGAAGPLIGGIFAAKFGLQSLFVVAPALLLLAMVPLYQSVDVVRSPALRFGGIFNRSRRDFVAHAALSSDYVVAGTIWPLFMYFVINDYFQLGAVISLSLFLTLAAYFVIGRLSDSVSKKALILMGSTGLALVNVFRNFAGTLWYAFGINIAGLIFSPLMSTPIFAVFYRHADQSRRIEYIVLLQMAGDVARAALWAIVLGLSLVASRQVAFEGAFLVAALTLGFTNIVRLRLPKRA
jgi:MFS family permease